MSALDEFKKSFEQFGTIGGLAVAGSVLTPIVSAASGLAPPRPDNLPFAASMLMLLTLALVFQFLPSRQSGYAATFVAGSALLVATLIAQVYLHMRFVDGQLILGCKWTDDTSLYASATPSIDPDAQCPGDYRHLLDRAENDPTQIWTPESIDQIALLLSVNWLLVFVMLAVALGSFVIYNGRQPGRPQDTPA